MNKKILGLTITLFALIMLATPVLAIGPVNAVGKNPNLRMLPYGIALKSPSGMNNEWVIVTPIPQHDMWMDASEFYRGNAIDVPYFDSIPEQAGMVYNPAMENKWLNLNQAVFEQMMHVWGFPSELIPDIVAQYPQGIYYKWVKVGK